MRAELVPIVAILLLSRSGDCRPQKTESSQPQTTKANAEEWKSTQPSSTPKIIREDSRYTWNSGNGRIPYINRYRDNIDLFTNAKVSVNEPKKMKPTRTVTRRSDADKFRNSPILFNDGDSPDSFAGINSVNSTRNGSLIRKLGESLGDSDRQISNIFNESTVRKKNLPTSPSHRQSKVSASTVDPGSFDNGFATSSWRNFHGKLDPTYRFPNSRSLYFRNRMTIGPSRRTEIELNNSRLWSALGHDSKAEFSDRRAEFSTGSDRNSAKVESWTEFDHVAAIKKITSMLTHENPAAISSFSSKPGHDFRDGVQSAVSFPYGSIFSNRHWNSKHSNKTRFRQPLAGQTSQNKNGQNKIVSNKILATKTNTSAQNTHLKNWPNGAIQNVDDFQHYEEYTSFADNSNLEKPVPLNNTSVNHLVPIASPNLHEIVHWWKIPAFVTNGSHIMESDQASDPISVAFDPVYQNLEPNKPSRPTTLHPFEPASVYPFISHPSYTTDKIPSWLGNVKLRNKTSYKPQTQVSQNTVVHLINTDPRKPNRTMIAAKVPVTFGKPVFSGFLGSPSGPPSALGSNTYTPSLFLSQLSAPSSTTSKPGPNVHIGFTSYEETNKTSDHRAPQAPLVTYDQSCPTILIDSYTRINNTIQSKEGCNDLNIIINSHVFNTNTLKSTPSPLDHQPNHETYQTYGEADKYVGQIGTEPSYHQPAPAYQYYSPQNDPGNVVPQGNDVSSDGNSVQVFQGAQINILGSNAQNAVTSFVDATSPAESSFEEFDESDSPDDNPNSESLENSSSLAESGSEQTDDAPGLNSVVQPAGAGLSDPSSSSNSPSSSTGLTAVSPSPSPDSASDDDDDDDFDLSPFGIMESIGSLFNYFTFVNPLHYGFFSLAAAPFTALAAGILGIFSFLFPWMFPGGFSLNRASRNYAVNFWPNVEEIVWPSIDNHGRMNEWKRRRKKRKR